MSRAIPPSSPLLRQVNHFPANEDVSEEWLDRARAGDVETWAEIYRTHFDPVYRHILYLTGEPSSADELVQETFIQALSNAHRFEGRSSLSTWLHGIALNLVRRHWKKGRSTAQAHERLNQMNQSRYGESPASQAGRPEHEVLEQQRSAALYLALETLPEHLREAFILRDLEGQSPEEAATQLGISKGNLAVRASRARRCLQQELVRQGIVDRNETNVLQLKKETKP